VRKKLEKRCSGACFIAAASSLSSAHATWGRTRRPQELHLSLQSSFFWRGILTLELQLQLSVMSCRVAIAAGFHLGGGAQPRDPRRASPAIGLGPQHWCEGLPSPNRARTGGCRGCLGVRRMLTRNSMRSGSSRGPPSFLWVWRSEANRFTLSTGSLDWPVESPAANAYETYELVRAPGRRPSFRESINRVGRPAGRPDEDSPAVELERCHCRCLAEVGCLQWVGDGWAEALCIALPACPPRRSCCGGCQWPVGPMRQGSRAVGCSKGLAWQREVRSVVLRPHVAISWQRQTGFDKWR
jgi:hypothetical protein